MFTFIKKIIYIIKHKYNRIFNKPKYMIDSSNNKMFEEAKKRAIDRRRIMGID